MSDLTRFDAQELAWWRNFALQIEPGSDMPKVGSQILGERYNVTLTIDPSYDLRRVQCSECTRSTDG